MVDLDETILMHEKFVSDITKATVERLLDNNVEVVWTTGRYYDAIPDYFLNNKRINYVASSNGAMIINNKTKEVLFNQNLDYKLGLKVIKMTNEKARHIFLVTNDGVYTDERLAVDKKVADKAFFITLMKQATIVDDLYEFVDENKISAQKIEIAFDDLDFRNKLYAYFDQVDGVSMTASHYTNFEAVSSGATKGASLLHLQKLLGLNKNQTMAIGDNVNDLSMIKAAGVGVAVGNAVEELKEAADFVTDSVGDEGFTKAIKKVFNF